VIFSQSFVNRILHVIFSFRQNQFRYAEDFILADMNNIIRVEETSYSDELVMYSLSTQLVILPLYTEIKRSEKLGTKKIRRDIDVLERENCILRYDDK
jgi:hypothetical protein